MSIYNIILRYVRKIKRVIESYECVDLNRYIHYTLGLWPPRDRDPSWFYPIQYIYYRLHVLFLLFLLTVICPITIYTHVDDSLQLCEDLTLMFIFLMTAMKTGSMLYYRDRLEDLGDQLKDFWDLEHGYPMSKQEAAIRKNTEKWAKIFTITLCIFANNCVIGGVMICSYSYFKRTFYISIWLPYDGDISPNFEITLALITFLFVLPLVQMIYFDIYVVVLMIHTVGQFLILRTNLKHVRKFAIQTLTATKTREVNSSTLQSAPSALEELFKVIEFDYPTGQERLTHWSYDVTTRGRGLIQGRTHEQASLKAKEHTEQEIDNEMQIRMKNCVKHHKQIISFVHDLEDTMQLPTIVQIFTYVCATGVSATWLTLVPAEKIDIVFWMYCNLTLALVIDTTLYFYLGEQITQQSSMVREAVYDCDWFEASEGFKRSMRIMMSMANQPIQWVAGYIVPLSLATFFDLSQTIYSYYAATRKRILS